MSSISKSLKNEFHKLDVRAKDAEQKVKNGAKSHYQKIVDRHHERQKNREDNRDEKSEKSTVAEIKANSEKIENLVFNSDYQLSDHQEKKFRRLVDKVEKSYDQLSDAFLNARKELSDDDLDSFFQVGTNIAELSDELVELLLDNDIDSQELVLNTCSQIEESCDTLSSCIESNYYKAA